MVLWIKKAAKRFVKDETAVVNVASYFLLITILVLGMIPGIVAIRNSYIQLFGDISGALESLDQSYSSTVAGVVSSYTDSAPIIDPVGAEPAGISVQMAPAVE